jgi:hypothetical protein
MPAPRAHPRRANSNHKPHWDADAHQLQWCGHVIKTFRHDAANQRRVLQAFQDRNWPSRIDDPLPVTVGVRRKERLRETVKSLWNSRGQRAILRTEVTRCKQRYVSKPRSCQAIVSK